MTQPEPAEREQLIQVLELLASANTERYITPERQSALLAGASALRSSAGLAWQPIATAPLSFAQFSAVNRERCESPQGFNHALGSWSLSDWFLATLGELGEAANVAKKLNRVRDGIPGNKETPDALRAKLRKECGDAFVYLDLLCQSAGFTIADAAVEVFNAKSEEIGCSIRMPLPGPPVALLASAQDLAKP